MRRHQAFALSPGQLGVLKWLWGKCGGASGEQERCVCKLAAKSGQMETFRLACVVVG